MGRQSVITVSSENRESFYICNPKIATPRESAQAYLQRIVVVLLGIVCAAMTWNITLNDCRFFVVSDFRNDDDYVVPGENIQGFANFTKEAMDIFGWGPNVTELWGWYSNLDFSPKSGNNAVFFGIDHYGIINLDEYHDDRDVLECESIETFLAENDILVSPDFRRYYDALYTLDYMMPILGTIGVMFSLVEFLFVVFYPSVIIGSIFFALAGIATAIMMLMVFLDARECFAYGYCKFYVNFWEYCFIMGGFFFCSCGLIFGKRTYPWFLRYNRDPNHCRVVEAVVVEGGDEEDYNDVEGRKSGKRQPLRFSLFPKRITKAITSLQNDTAGACVVSLEEHQQLKDELEEMRKQIALYEEELQDARNRALKAETLLRAGKGASFRTSVLNAESQIDEQGGLDVVRAPEDVPNDDDGQKMINIVN